MKGKIFNAQEVQAIIAGNKTMFREIVKRRKKVWQYKLNENGIREVPCPYKVGQKIFCKEEWDFVSDREDGMGDCLYYKADMLKFDKEVVRRNEEFMKRNGHTWKPAQHMKQEHSRLTLLIKEIRGERLQELSFWDALREGASDAFKGGFDMSKDEILFQKFESNWNTTHKKPEEKFEANPWVWCVSFEVINN